MINSRYNFLFLFFVLLYFFSFYNILLTKIILFPIEINVNNYAIGTTYSCQCIYNLKDKNSLYINVVNNNIKIVIYNINKTMSTYLKKSSISLINKYKKSMFILDNNMSFVIHESINNLFINPHIFYININNLVKVWERISIQNIKVPKFHDIYNIIKYNTFSVLFINNQHVINSIFLNKLYVLSASAKGYCVDQIYKIFKISGYGNILCEVGGEIRVAGINKRYNLWNIGLIEPQQNNLWEQLITLFKIYDSSLATSGLYLNNTKIYIRKDLNVSHIINHISGMPILTLLKNVNIIFPSCMLSDILSTTIIINHKQTMKYLKSIVKFLRIIFVYMHMLNYSTKYILISFL